MVGCIFENWEANWNKSIARKLVTHLDLSALQTWNLFFWLVKGINSKFRSLFKKDSTKQTAQPRAIFGLFKYLMLFLERCTCMNWLLLLFCFN